MGFVTPGRALGITAIVVERDDGVALAYRRRRSRGWCRGTRRGGPCARSPVPVGRHSRVPPRL